jgi:hypothetical protein
VAGTQLTDIDNKPVAGNLNVSIQHFDNRGATRGFLPTGGVATNPVDANGKSLANPFDLPNFAGFVSVVMSNDQGQIVKQLSKPLELSLELNPATYNPRTKLILKLAICCLFLALILTNTNGKQREKAKLFRKVAN